MIRIKLPLLLLAYAACVLGLAPLYPYLQSPAQLLLPACLATSVYCDRKGRYPLGGRIATALTLALFGYYLLQVNMTYLVDPMANLLALVLAVRLVSEKSPRNLLQLHALTLFTLAASTLYSLEPSFFVYLVLLILVVAISLVLLTFATVDEELALTRAELKRVLAVAGVLPLVSLVLMLVFFVILPRTQHPLWNFLNPQGQAQTGFAETVAPGSYAGLAEVGSLAFRVETEELAAEELYWRGTVLSRIEGHRWLRAPPSAEADARLVGGRQVRQVIYPEPRQSDYLFSLDPPQSLTGVRARGSADRVFRAKRPLTKRVAYQVVSRPGARIVEKNLDRSHYLQLPRQVSERARELGRRIAEEGETGTGRIRLLQDFFSSQKLSYDNRNLPPMADPVDGFLFEHRRGYCEFFASSFATVLRLSGVPARLVGGYYGGRYNDLGGYYLVSDDMAHVWVEAYVSERGWQRIDPSTLAANAGAALEGRRAGGIGRWRSLSDAINYYWNRSVVSYDLEGQFRLLRRADERLRGVGQLSWRRREVLYLLVIVGGVGGGIALLRHRRRGPAQQRLLQAFLARLQRCYGVETSGGNRGLQELTAGLDDSAVIEFVQIYSRAVYRDRPLGANERQRLRRLLRRIGRDKP